MKVQKEIQDDIENGCENISELFPGADTSVIMVFYFLMFWSRVMYRYGKHGEKEDNKFLISQITRMMSGDIPRDIDGVFDKEKAN